MEYVEVVELAAVVLGKDAWADDFDEGDVDEALYEKFEVDIVQFWKIAEALIKFTPAVESAMTGKLHRGFVFDGTFIAKEAV